MNVQTLANINTFWEICFLNFHSDIFKKLIIVLCLNLEKGIGIDMFMSCREYIFSSLSFYSYLLYGADNKYRNFMTETELYPQSSAEMSICE